MSEHQFPSATIGKYLAVASKQYAWPSLFFLLPFIKCRKAVVTRHHASDYLFLHVLCPAWGFEPRLFSACFK